jgi:hypothetical protein
MPGRTLLRFARRDGGYDFVDPATKEVVRTEPGDRRPLPPDQGWSRDPGKGFDRSTAPAPNYRPLQGAADNNRGNSVILEPVISSGAFGIVNGTGKIATVVQAPRDSGQDAEVITVTLGLSWDGIPEGDVPSAGIALVKANVGWGVGGASFKAVLDWNNGTVFSLPASFINVGAIYEGVGAGGTDLPNAILTASLAYGDTGRSDARLTQVLEAMDPTDSQVLNVPPFARGFMVCTNQGSPSLQMECWSASSAAIATAFNLATFVYSDTSNFSGQKPGFFPIPNGTRAIKITNLGAVRIEDISALLVWDLSL